MYFIKTDQAGIGELDLADQIKRELLSGKKVLWIISGGSNIPRTVSILQILNQISLDNLTIMLGDERYGEIGHQDSNAHQLDLDGFDPMGARFIPVLINESLSNTLESFKKTFEDEVKESDFIIAQLGMGADGHISGILPGSEAVSSKEYAVSYAADDFTRISLTKKALLQVDTVFVFATGKDKLEALTNLQTRDLSPEIQPAQILKAIKHVYIYNDQVGDME
jgi:6-phosphogluconolactonase/glucosamine-6-phosphate isomerase/deaminase